MLSSSPSRRQLLQWAAGAACFAGSAWAGDLFPRKDPLILTQTYRRLHPIELGGRAINVGTIACDQPGKPAPPDFAPFLVRALEWAFPESTVSKGDGAEAEVLIRGRIDLFHRLGAQGLRVKVSLAAFDLSGGEALTLWRGAKRADWRRRFPADDCLLTLADDFVAEWTA